MPYFELTFLTSHSLSYRNNLAKHLLLKQTNKKQQIPSHMRLTRGWPRAAASLIYSLNHQPARATYSSLLGWWESRNIKILKAYNINKCSTWSFWFCPPVTESVIQSLFSLSHWKTFVNIPSDTKLFCQLPI